MNIGKASAVGGGMMREFMKFNDLIVEGFRVVSLW